MHKFCRVWAVLAALFLASCALAAETGRRGGRIVVAQRAEPRTFNPVTAIDAPSREVIRRITADLVTIDRQTLRTVPGLAESWTISKDGKRFVLQLRKNVKFSDGHPFDADDVLFTFQVYLDESLHSSQRDLLLIHGKPVTVTKLGQYSVGFAFADSYAAADRLFDSIAILPRHILESPYKAGTLEKAWSMDTAPAKIVGLGPFRLKANKPGERIVLERNPYYWKRDDGGNSLPYMDELEFVAAGSEDAQLTRFLGGESNLTNRLASRNFTLLANEKPERGVDVRDAGPSLEYTFLVFNLSPEKLSATPYFGRTPFRQAVSAAIDRDSIVKLIYGGRAAALRTHVSPGNTAWIDRSLPPLPGSPDRARNLLKADGFTWNSTGSLLDPSGKLVEFSILTSAGNQERGRIATLIQDDLKQIGIKVTIAALEFRSLNDRLLNTRQFDAVLHSLGGGDGDPNPEINVWLSSGGLHLWNPNQKTPATPWEAELDRLMRLQMTTMNPAERKRMYDRVQQIEADNVPLIALVSPHVLVAAKAGLGNFQPAVVDHYTLWNCEWLFWRKLQDPRR